MGGRLTAAARTVAPAPGGLKSCNSVEETAFADAAAARVKKAGPPPAPAPAPAAAPMCRRTTQAVSGRSLK